MESDDIGIYAQAILLAWLRSEQGKIKSMILSRKNDVNLLIHNGFHFLPPQKGANW